MRDTKYFFSRVLISILFGLTFFSQPFTAQNTQTNNGNHSPGLVLLCLSAHPDDEDGATLAYYAKLRGVRAYSIFYTRGEGGQNEIGSELYDDLGKVRTKETLEAAAILGTEVHFLGYPDFGFSKTATETFKKWGGKDSVLDRLVYYIRALKPDVIITNHDTITTVPGRQHGNHQAVGITAFEAFVKAADPRYHPEQFSKDTLGPWQVKKLFFRYFDLSKRDSSVEVNTTEKDSNGMAIEQTALTALAKHRSQGMDKITASMIPERYRKHYYMLIKSNAPYPFAKNDLFSGISPPKRIIINVPFEADTSQSTSKTRDTLTPPANLQATVAPNIIIGLVKTYDETNENTLKAFHINYRLIDSSILATSNLDTFSTILLDLRTYFYRHDALEYNKRLLDYVQNGGNIVCFYHKTGDWSGKFLAPYPLQLTGERVTEEDAKVTELLPQHRLLQTPNVITLKDWSGWVQERNIYLPNDDTLQTSARYQRLLAMSDEGEHQPSTSLITTRYGKGTYTYVSLVLYRQLRVFQEGSIKLFFNLISQPRK